MSSGKRIMTKRSKCHYKKSWLVISHDHSYPVHMHYELIIAYDISTIPTKIEKKAITIMPSKLEII